MIILPASCPDCAHQLTVIRELPDDTAVVAPRRCPGCMREWGAVILTHRLADASLMYTPRLIPLDGRGVNRQTRRSGL